jgi:hypothetical protein
VTDPGTQVVASEGEPCRECGAPLALDQRYCLNCGRRRGEPRIDFRGHLPVTGPAGADDSAPTEQRPPATAADPAAGKGAQRDYTPLAAVGGIAVLGVMLLIGVLIGKGDSGGTATAPAPVVVQGGEAGVEKGAVGEGEAEAREGATAKAKGGGKGKGGDVVAGGSSNTGSAPVASDEALQQLQEQSPQEYSESSAKLPDEIATGGAPPPQDDKAPGGGGKSTAIE